MRLGLLGHGILPCVTSIDRYRKRKCYTERQRKKGHTEMRGRCTKEKDSKKELSRHSSRGKVTVKPFFFVSFPYSVSFLKEYLDCESAAFRNGKKHMYRKNYHVSCINFHINCGIHVN